jgi:hypothetical protein
MISWDCRHRILSSNKRRLPCPRHFMKLNARSRSQTPSLHFIPVSREEPSGRHCTVPYRKYKCPVRYSTYITLPNAIHPMQVEADEKASGCIAPRYGSDRLPGGLRHEHGMHMENNDALSTTPYQPTNHQSLGPHKHMQVFAQLTTSDPTMYIFVSTWITGSARV